VFAELHFPSCTLALGDASTAQLFNDAARPAANQTAIIEWIVEDVDAEFKRLQPIVDRWEQEPTLMPWGNRSILFRDPDGNLVNLFTPVSPEAVQRFAQYLHR
jgi:catechol 2,3-dioxygenase-like lactoylglutathione lyase family enzyme